MKFEINRSEIVDEEVVCPYCMNKMSGDMNGCCGESSAHFELAYILESGEAVLKSQAKIIEDILEV